MPEVVVIEAETSEPLHLVKEIDGVREPLEITTAVLITRRRLTIKRISDHSSRPIWEVISSVVVSQWVR